jgi:hypothetical protein
VATDQLRQLKLDNVGPLDGVRSAFGFEPQPMEGGLGHLRFKLRDQEPDVMGSAVTAGAREPGAA